MENKKILMVIADRDFRDEEYLVPKEIFQDDALEVVTANLSGEEAEGTGGAKVQVDISLEQVVISDYDAIVLVGGMGAKDYFDNSFINQMVKDAYSLGKIIGAICLAPVILANAGILKGKKATCSNGYQTVLESMGAIFSGKEVEIDGKIITANGPLASENFARAIAKLLAQEE